MRKKIPHSMTVLSLFSIIAAALAVSLAPPQGTANAPNAAQGQEKKLREIAMERDVELENNSECNSEYGTLEHLLTEAKAVVYGRIIESKSYFDTSGAHNEFGEVITTEYNVEVLRDLRENTLKTPCQ